jgi:thiosulfate dehydrogenase
MDKYFYCFKVMIILSVGTLFANTGFCFQESELPAAEEVTIMSGPLISSATAMETAWDIPKNPLTDSLLAHSPLAEQIKSGFLIFTETSKHAPRFSGNALSCTNCHLNAGQREKAMPLVGVAALFPEYNKRQARLISLEDRIVGCFLRSQNSTEVLQHQMQNITNAGHQSVLPATDSKEVLDVSAYLTWLSEGYPVGKKILWRGQNTLPQEKILPIEKLDTKLGYTLFIEKCSNCHGEDGQGVAIGDKKAGPLWGKDSWNDGAGAARIYTLAGMIRYAMPYIDPGSLTDEEAQHVAAYINSQPRPTFPFKDIDYVTEPLPKDAVYYKRPSKK